MCCKAVILYVQANKWSIDTAGQLRSHVKKWPFLTVLPYRGPAPAHASLATVHQQHSLCWCLSQLDFYKKKSMVSSKKGNSYPSCLKVPLLVVTVLLSKGFFYFTAVAVYSATHYTFCRKHDVCATGLHPFIREMCDLCKKYTSNSRSTVWLL